MKNEHIQQPVTCSKLEMKTLGWMRLMLKIKTQEQRRSDTFTVNFEHI